MGRRDPRVFHRDLGGKPLQRRGLRLVVVSEKDGTAHEVRLPQGFHAFGLGIGIGIAVFVAALMLLFAGYTRTERHITAEKARIAHLVARINHQNALVATYRRDESVAGAVTKASAPLSTAVAAAERSVGVHKTTAIPKAKNIVDVLTVLADVNQVLPTTAEDAYVQAEYLGHSQAPYPFIWPMYGPLTSPFGMRVDPVIHVYQLHAGIDIGAQIGRPIYAAAPGCVGFEGVQVGYGKVLFIHDPDGITTVYSHDSRFYVRRGQCVHQGQLIAAAGNTGWSTGPHLLFEIRWGGDNGTPVNPLKWLPPRDYYIATPTLGPNGPSATQVAVATHKALGMQALAQVP